MVCMMPTRAVRPAAQNAALDADWARIEPAVRKLLGRDVSPSDHFFRVGGHSLLAIQLVNTLRRDLGVDIPMRAPFDHPTLRELATVVGAAVARSTAADPDVDAPQDATPVEAPLTVEQQGVWFDQVTNPGSTAMNMPLHGELPPEIGLDAVVATLRFLVLRHDVLRVRIRVKDGKPVQWIDDGRPPRITIVDLAGLGDAAARRVAESLGSAQVGTPFDLAAEDRSVDAMEPALPDALN